jgi:hypothetical protein
MSKFLVGAAELGRLQPVSFAEFVQLVKGRSIVTAADWGEERVEFGLSGWVLRIAWGRNGIDVSIFSTTNDGETPPLVLVLPEDNRRLPLREVEKRLAALRLIPFASIRFPKFLRLSR